MAKIDQKLTELRWLQKICVDFLNVLYYDIFVLQIREQFGIAKDELDRGIFRPFGGIFQCPRSPQLTARGTTGVCWETRRNPSFRRQKLTRQQRALKTTTVVERPWRWSHS